MKKMIPVILIVAFAVIAFLIYRNRRNNKPLECPKFEPMYEGGRPFDSSEGYDIEKEVVIGDYGPEVAYVQERLNTQYGAEVTVDGKFGCETWQALYDFAGLDGADPIDLNDLK